jgi:hypothetical protein
MSIYIRLFNSPNSGVKLSDKKIPFGYFPWEMRIGLQKSKIPQHNFIICPIYKNMKSGEISDVQPGITGHVEDGETNFAAFSREAGEEIGIIPDLFLEPVFKNKKFCIYSVNVQNCIKVKKNEQGKHSEFTELTGDKVGGFIHGDFYSISKYINSEIYRYNNLDTDIIGVSMISRSDIEKLLHIN